MAGNKDNNNSKIEEVIYTEPYKKKNPVQKNSSNTEVTSPTLPPRRYNPNMQPEEPIYQNISTSSETAPPLPPKGSPIAAQSNVKPEGQETLPSAPRPPLPPRKRTEVEKENPYATIDEIRNTNTQPTKSQANEPIYETIEQVTGSQHPTKSGTSHIDPIYEPLGQHPKNTDLYAVPAEIKKLDKEISNTSSPHTSAKGEVADKKPTKAEKIYKKIIKPIIKPIKKTFSAMRDALTSSTPPHGSGYKPFGKTKPSKDPTHTR